MTLLFYRLLFFSLLTWRPPISTLFPYTTLFRSGRPRRRLRRPGPHVGDRAPAERLPADGGHHAAPLRHAPRPRAHELLRGARSEEHTSELQSRQYLVCRLLLEKKKNQYGYTIRS